MPWDVTIISGSAESQKVLGDRDPVVEALRSVFPDLELSIAHPPSEGTSKRTGRISRLLAQEH
jgi:hypothetical protein